MATEKKRLKGRFLYLFDWNAKSRKKLFSNKSESSEVSNQGKESVGNLVIPQCLLRELNENEDHSSFRESGNYSCGSSVNGDDVYGTRAPGLVARLMGLDSMPSTSCEASSISSYETGAVSSSYYNSGVAASQRKHHILDHGYVPNKDRAFPWSSMDSKSNKVHCRPIERFQTEVLPPKSAKPISITHHKLLSPIKSPGFVPTKDAAYIMEAAARIIDSSPHPTARINIASLSSPSSSFRLQDLKEKIDAAQRSSRDSRRPEFSKTLKMSASVEQIRGNSSDRSSNRSLFKSNMGSEASSSQKMKNKGKSVSVPVRDKAKMHRIEGLVCSDNRNRQKEPKQAKLKPKQTSTQKARETRTSVIKSSGVLRQNNDKQNTVVHRDKPTSKTLFSDQQPRKITPGGNCAGPSKIVNKVFVNVENGLKKVDTSTNATDKRAPLNDVAEKRPSLNKMKSISRVKQSAVRHNVPDNTEERSLQNGHSCQSDSGKDLDVISFTFTSPIKKAGTQSLSPIKSIGGNYRHLSSDSSAVNGQVHETSLVSQTLGLDLVDSSSLSHLLEQKLRELSDKLVSNKSDSVSESFNADSLSCLLESNSSSDVAGATTTENNEWSRKHQTSTACDDDGSLYFVSKSSQKHEKFEDAEGLDISGSNKCGASRESDLDHLNISVRELSSCVSSSTTSHFTIGYDQPSSPQSQEVVSRISSKSFHPREEDSDFADVTSQWELEYVRYVLHYSGLKRFWLDKHYNIIDPAVFDLLENLLNTSGRNGELCSKLERRILFDCVAEIVTSRYELVFLGSRKAWAKWEMLLHNDCLTEDVFKDVSGLQSKETLLVDELVESDMSSWYGRWLDFEIESLEEGIDLEGHILTSLVDELVDDLCTQSFSR